jgi:hypothetical protein
MQSKKKRFYRLRINGVSLSLIFASLMLVICGCSLSPIADIAANATRDRNIEWETIFIKEPPADVLQTAAAVGESMGYHRIPTNYSSMILLESKTGLMTSLLAAHDKENNISVYRITEGLKIEVTASGTFGAGSRSNAKKILAEYKENLLNKLALR